jgi:hypothetical protein
MRALHLKATRLLLRFFSKKYPLSSTRLFNRICPLPKTIRNAFEHFINHARKPQAFRPGDEWHPFEAKPGGTWRSGANFDMIWPRPNIRLSPIRNNACSTTWCGYPSIVGAYCEAKWSSALESCCMKHVGSISGGLVS